MLRYSKPDYTAEYLGYKAWSLRSSPALGLAPARRLSLCASSRTLHYGELFTAVLFYLLEEGVEDLVAVNLA